MGKSVLLKKRNSEQPPERADTVPIPGPVGEAEASPTPSPHSRSKKVLYIGFDAEWYTHKTEEFFREEKTKYGTTTRLRVRRHFRKVLSVQAWGIYEGKDLGGLIFWTVDPADPHNSSENRPSLREFLNFCLCEWDLSRENVKKIVLISHFNLVDYSVFRDFHYYLNEKPSRGFMRIKKCYRGKIPKRKSPVKIPILLRDTFEVFHCPLKSLGKLLGVEKITLGEGDIEDMATLLKRDRKLYEAYALRDAELAVKGWLAHQDFCKREGLRFAPTAGGVAERTLEGILKNLDEGELKKNLFEKRIYETRKGVTVTRIKPISHIREDYYNWVRSYYGGRNETWLYGYWKGFAVDLDLCGAYGTIISNIPLYRPIPHEFTNPDPRELYDAYRDSPTALGYVVGFFTLRDNRVGGIPVRDENATYFVCQAKTTLTLQEFLALFPRLNLEKTYISKAKIFEPLAELSETAKLARKFIEKRLEAKQNKDKFGDKFFKLLVNSFYGKFAQGVRADIERYALGKQYPSDNIPPPSLITNVAIAAYITGFIRGLAFEALNKFLELGLEVVAWTTDGALCLVPGGIKQFKELKEKIYSAQDFGILHDTFRRFREEIAGSGQVYERKHTGFDVLAIRTRAYAILRPISLEGEEPEPFFAFTGVQKKTIKNLEEGKKEAEIIFELWTNLERGERLELPETRFVTKTEFQRAYETFFLQKRELSDPEEEAELLHAFDPGNNEEVFKSLSFDYDWKRRPVRIEACPEIPGRVRFKTVASWDVGEILKRREYATHFQKRKGMTNGKMVYSNKFLSPEAVREFLKYLNLKTQGVRGIVSNKKIKALAGAWFVKNHRVSIRKVAAFLGLHHTSISYHIKHSLNGVDFEKIFKTQEFQEVIRLLEKEFEGKNSP